jgi:nitrous oxide reductase
MENIDESNDEPNDEPTVEPDAPLKKKRVVSERQLENLKQARELARKALNAKRKETTAIKMKEKQLKLLVKLEKARSTDQQLVDLREKCLEPVKIEPVAVEPVKDEPVKVEPTLYLKKKKKKTKPRIVWLSDSDSSDEEIVYKKKSKPRNVPVVPAPVTETVKPDQEAVKHVYNEKMAKIRREYVMSQMFPC